MNLARNAVALCQDSRITRLQPVDVQSIKQSRHQDDGHKYESQKKTCLKKSRLQMKSEHGSCLIPGPIQITCDYTEAILPRREVGVVGKPPGSRVYPLSVKAFKPVFIAHPFGSEVTERRKVDLDFTGAERDLGFTFDRLLLFVDHHFFDVDGGHEFAGRHPRRDGGHQSLQRTKHQRPVCGFPGCGLITGIAGSGLHPILNSVIERSDLLDLTLCKSPEFVLAYSE